MDCFGQEANGSIVIGLDIVVDGQEWVWDTQNATFPSCAYPIQAGGPDLNTQYRVVYWGNDAGSSIKWYLEQGPDPPYN